ncbi:hypothetical protein RIF29_08814 [Crotalaria pallida]|uniref:Uncharacterized protein n=1 Tax=Crotalaria pallida TaxID=3830 RepID=A0AAN9ILK5_CROPI
MIASREGTCSGPIALVLGLLEPYRSPRWATVNLIDEIKEGLLQALRILAVVRLFPEILDVLGLVAFEEGQGVDVVALIEEDLEDDTDEFPHDDELAEDPLADIGEIPAPLEDVPLDPLIDEDEEFVQGQWHEDLGMFEDGILVYMDEESKEEELKDLSGDEPSSCIMVTPRYSPATPPEGSYASNDDSFRASM